MPYYVYIIQCKDEKFYTGITNDLERRIKSHNSGKGGRFTRSRTPVTLMHSERCRTKSKALKREAQIKSWPRPQKLTLITGDR